MADRIHPVEDTSAHARASAPAADNGWTINMPNNPESVSKDPKSVSEEQEFRQKQQEFVRREQERSLLNQRDDIIYGTPAPLPPNHPSYRVGRRRRSPCCCCLAWSCGILATIVVLLGIAALVLYLVLQPKSPQFSVTDAHISVFNLSATPLQSAPSPDAIVYLQADVTFTIQAQNPNKKIGIYYDSVDVTLFYDGASIGNGSLPAFYQGFQNTTQLELEMKGQDVPLTQSIGTLLESELNNSSSSIPLQVKTITQVRVSVGSWKSGDSKFEVDCDVQISNPTAGSVRLLSKTCSFKLKSLKPF